MRSHRILTLIAVLAVALAAPAAASARQILIGGSTSVLPLAEKLAVAFHRQYPGVPKPKVTGGQSDVGISGVAEGRFDIGDSSRDPLETDPHHLIWTKIAHDGICVITNKANPIKNMSHGTVEEIFTGQIRDWSQVPGAKISGPIDLFDRDGASGTQDAFQHIFLNEETKVSQLATPKTSNGLERSSVQSDKQGVGFVSFAFTGGVNAVGYNNIACNLANARSGQYGGVRTFWMIVKRGGNPVAFKFIKWIKAGGSAVNHIINSSWIAIW